MLDIGLTLRKYRNKCGYSQQYVANVIGISRVAYRKWEDNQVDFALSQLRKVSELYELSLQDIISDAHKAR
ncbi:helix-turn-helix transcriptional regulator [Pedobacter sp. AW1-32]|uniref:helix-turn-helix transcriptional regulator n=1 Tax=Pedobacter sp. AW1-32 TaxID=3383026 RepID=UPI003FED8A60